MDKQPPTYDQAADAYNTSQTIKQESESGFLDANYYKNLFKVIPKAVEVLGSLIAYICVEVNSGGCGWAFTTTGYFKFISMFAFATTLILWALLLFKIPQRILRCDCVNWPFFETCYYAGIVIFYFFGCLFLAINNCSNPGLQAGCAFGFIALFAYGYEAAFGGFHVVRARRAARSSAQQDAESPRY